MQDFERFVEIRHSVFEKSNVLGQNWVWGRFSQFLANLAFVAVTKYTNVKVMSRSTDSRNLNFLSQLVYPQHLFDRYFKAPIELHRGESSLTPVLFNGNFTGTFWDNQMSAAEKLIEIECSNFLSLLNLTIPFVWYTL